MSEIDYAAVLADLEQKRDELDAAIKAIQPFVGAGAQARTARAGSEELQPDSFFGMNILDAAVKYLHMAKRPKRADEIADALLAGGYMTTAKNFQANVQTTLRREDDREGSTVWMPNKTWALAEWYPSRPKKQGVDPKDDSEDERGQDPPVTDTGDTTDVASPDTELEITGTT